MWRYLMNKNRPIFNDKVIRGSIFGKNNKDLRYDNKMMYNKERRLKYAITK